MTLSAWLTTWMDAFIRPSKTISTIKGYEKCISYLDYNLLLTNVNELSAIDVQLCLSRLCCSKPRQSQILYAILHSSMERAVKLGQMEKNIMRALDKPSHRSKETVIYTQEQLIKYCDVAADDAKCGTALLLMALCGLRRGEVLGLRLSDVRDKTIRIEQQRQGARYIKCKTRESRREIPVETWLIERIKDKPGTMICGYNQTTLTKHHQKIVNKAGLPYINLHALRHTCGTMMIEKGADVVAVQHYFGHENYQTTVKYYLHRTSAIKMIAMSAMSGLTSGHDWKSCNG